MRTPLRETRSVAPRSALDERSFRLPSSDDTELFNSRLAEWELLQPSTGSHRGACSTKPRDEQPSLLARARRSRWITSTDGALINQAPGFVRSASKSGREPPMDSFDHAVEKYHAALREFVKGDSGPVLPLFSQRDDAVLCNPFRPFARGPGEIGGHDSTSCLPLCRRNVAVRVRGQLQHR
jgi:hypothetical protein